jgi:flagellar hook protein FlgE
MTGAMYSAVAGLKAHMNKLNVIGNNVANVNTYGYKSARTTFKESLYSSVRSGSNGSDSTGGVNPAQVGYGCNIGTIDLDMSTKNYVPTGQGLDCMINGDGFFLVGQKAPAGSVANTLKTTEAKDLELTRVGNFTFDSQGYMVDGYGKTVYGFVTRSGAASDATPAAAAGVGDSNDPAVSTQLVPIRLPLSAKADSGATPPVLEGAAYFPGISGTGDTKQNVYDDGTKTNGKPIAMNLDSISIDGATGKITGVNNADGKIVVVGYIPLAKVSNPNGVTHIQGPYYKAGEGAGDCQAASIGGAVKGNLDNDTTTDAVPIFGTGGTAIITNGLESSGTDVATEFSEMISTQRGYQANTRIITVTDSMLEELVNIKR